MKYIVGLCCAMLLSAAACLANDLPLDVRMELKPETIVLGEPVWVDVYVHNRSALRLLVDPGNSCFGAHELTVQVPAAEAARERLVHCGVVEGGSCVTPLPRELAPNGTLTLRYVMRGDFRIAHPGNYSVLLTQNFQYGAIHLNQADLIQQKLTLHVFAADASKLLSIEQTLAQRVVTPLRLATRDAQIADEQIRLSIADGLATYPASGMEPVFEAWLAQNNTTWADYALTALYHLNTPAARQILARQAASPEKPNDISFQIHRWLSIEKLGLMGDTLYLPLIERLTRDRYHDMQRSAVHALGNLGGEKELPLLNRLARTASTETDRSDAIQAMGDSDSLKAVPLLIDLFDLPNADQPNSSGFALWTLTRHNENWQRLPTPQQAKSAWQQWWSQNQRTARAYGPFECSTGVAIESLDSIFDEAQGRQCARE